MSNNELRYQKLDLILQAVSEWRILWEHFQYFICCYCPYRCGERQKTWCCLHMFKHQLCRGTGEESSLLLWQSNTLSKSTVTASLGCDWVELVLFQSLIFICSRPNVWTRALTLMSIPAVQSGWTHSCAKVKTCFAQNPKMVRSPSHRRKEINGHIYLRTKTESKLWLCIECINRFTCL